MARKRKSRKKSYSRRRRSMSGVGSTMGSVLPIIAGAVAGKILAKTFESKVKDSKFLSLGQIGAGILLPRVIKNKFVAGMGTGMIVSGSVSALSDFGVMKGIAGFMGAEDFSEYEETISGTDALQTIAGYVDEGTLTGTDALQTIAATEGYDDMDYDY